MKKLTIDVLLYRLRPSVRHYIGVLTELDPNKISEEDIDEISLHWLDATVTEMMDTGQILSQLEMDLWEAGIYDDLLYTEPPDTDLYMNWEWNTAR